MLTDGKPVRHWKSCLMRAGNESEASIFAPSRSPPSSGSTRISLSAAAIQPFRPSKVVTLSPFCVLTAIRRLFRRVGKDVLGHLREERVVPLGAALREEPRESRRRRGPADRL